MAAPKSSTFTVVLGGRIERADIPRLCERVRVELANRHTDTVVCDVSTLEQADATVVDALARLQLTALRLGSRIQLLRPSEELRELLGLAGLTHCVPPLVELPLEIQRQTEQREEARGIEEETDSRDSIA